MIIAVQRMYKSILRKMNTDDLVEEYNRLCPLVAKKKMASRSSKILCHSLRCTGNYMSYREFNVLYLLNKSPLTTEVFSFTDTGYITLDLIITMRIFEKEGMPIVDHTNLLNRSSNISKLIDVHTEQDLFNCMLTHRGAILNITFCLFSQNAKYISTIFGSQNPREINFLKANAFSSVYRILDGGCYQHWPENYFDTSVFDLPIQQIYLRLGLMLHNITSVDSAGYTIIDGPNLKKGRLTKVLNLDDSNPVKNHIGNCVVLNAIVENSFYIPITKVSL